MFVPAEPQGRGNLPIIIRITIPALCWMIEFDVWEKTVMKTSRPRSMDSQ